MTITESDYFEILSEVGYPIVKEEDLEFTREDIQNMFIFPAMREYFTWFPIEEVYPTKISSNFSIPFPDENTFGIVDSRLNTAFSNAGTTASPFMNELLYKVSRTRGAYGTENDYGFTQANYLERAENRANLDYGKSFKVTVDNVNRRVTGYTNTSGELIITWAKWSDNFSAIPFRRKSEVIDLAKSKVLKGFVMLRGQLNADIGVEFDIGLFEDRSKELEEKTLEKWKSMTKIAIIRG